MKRVPFKLKHVLFALLIAGGCKDDRKVVASEVFLCSATSHTADYDCGDGYLCYGGAQALGDSFCVPQCDPAHADKTCPGGACTAGHECLARCTVGDPRACASAGGLLSCVRTTYSPLEAKNGNDGVCAPVAFSCTTSADCGSPVYNLCTSDTDGQLDNDQLLKTGSVCAQGHCGADGVACEPGSTCIVNVLPAAAMPPDVCTPNCLRRSLPNDGGVVEECPVGFTCLEQAFPQTTTRVCAPGLPGWICKDRLGCVAGDCAPWSDVGGTFNGLTTCAPSCGSDADCVIYDKPGNPDVLSHFTCVNGQCRHLQSLFFSGVCNKKGDACALDPQATCNVSDQPVAPPADGGAGDDCSTMVSGAQSSSLTANGSLCQRTCSDDSQCATLTANAHVTYLCVGGSCLPSAPFIFPCTDDASCMPGLSCLAPPMAPPGYRVCTLACNSTADCAQNPSLGSNFACALNRCIPKTGSGCTPALQLSDLCLSGQLGQSGLCLSPAGWVCDKDARCLSGQCVAGHCQ